MSQEVSEPKPIKISPEHLERLVEFIRRSGRPQTIESLTRRYIDILRDGK